MKNLPAPLLENILDPSDLRRLEPRQLPALAQQLREFLIESVSKTGGHLSSNLGTVELTLALHYVFDTPHDRLVWDVGHQTYCHKILTGRREAMNTLRQYGGLAGFPRRSESPYDTFGVGHSSTSISAALGMALAAKHKGESRHVVAIIGDGAMTAGQAFEALNNAGVADADLLVILNDNDMSISPPVGALNKYLARLLSGRMYSGVRQAAEKMLGVAPNLLELARRAEEHVKGMVMPGTLFEEFGFNYIGPIDGHDLDSLLPTLQNLKERRGPQFLHVVTRKGQGYKLAEADPTTYHGVSKFSPEQGIVGGKGGGKKTFTEVFGDWICDQAAADERLIGITPAMREGSGLVRFAEHYPSRYFDVGIAEQHAVTLGAGLACEGLKPVVAIYSTFLQRAYDQLVHDVALQNLDVTFAIDRGGLVGADGATHHGAFDLSFLLPVPNLAILCPADEAECRSLLATAWQHPGPAAVRYPRGSATGTHPGTDLTPLPWGRGEIRRQGVDTAILAFGPLLANALAAGDTLNATVANMRFAKPLDRELITQLAREHTLLVTVEENALTSGVGGEVAHWVEALVADGTLARRPALLRLGLPDQFIDHGEQARLLADCGLDTAGIVQSIQKRCQNPHQG